MYPGLKSSINPIHPIQEAKFPQIAGGIFLDKKSSRSCFWGVGNIHENISQKKLETYIFLSSKGVSQSSSSVTWIWKVLFAFHKRCGSPQWWWLHKSSNTCRLSDLWETSKSYLLNCNESRLCLWLSRQRVQFPDPLVMRYDIRLSYHRDFTLFPKLRWYNGGIIFKISHDLLADVPGRCFSEQVGLSSQCSLQPLVVEIKKTNRCFRSKLSLEVQSDELSTPVLLCIKFIFNDNFLDPVSKTRWLFFNPLMGKGTWRRRALRKGRPSFLTKCTSGENDRLPTGNGTKWRGGL